MLRTVLVLAIATIGLGCAKNVDEPAITTTPSTAGNSSSGSGDTGGDGSTSGMTGASMTTAPMTTAADTAASADGTSSGGPGSTGGNDTAPAGCGDGVISPGEQCDGTNLQNFDCTSLGLNGGTLSCDPVTCTFDTSMCMSTTGGTGG